MRLSFRSSLFVSACIAVVFARQAAAGEDLSPTAVTFEKNHLEPEVRHIEAALEKLLGAKVDIVVDVGSYDKNYGLGSVLADSSDVMKGFKNNCFDPLMAVMDELTKSPEMKSKLAKNLKKIDIKNTGDSDPTWGSAVFNGSTLTFSANATKNIEGAYAYKTKIVLSAALKGEARPSDWSGSDSIVDQRTPEAIQCQRGCNQKCGAASNKSKCVSECRRACPD